jgi:hypothetical protein
LWVGDNKIRGEVWGYGLICRRRLVVFQGNAMGVVNITFLGMNQDHPLQWRF